MGSYFLRHAQVLFDTLGRMWKTPLPTIMTIAVLGIAIALPLVLFKVADSLQDVAGSWQGKPEISVFLDIEEIAKIDQDIDEAAIIFGQDLLNIPAIEDIQYVSPAEAMVEFRNASGFGNALDALDQNPLPPLLVVYPQVDQTADQIQTLVEQIRSKPEVDDASFDQLWLKRLGAILQVFRRGVIVLSLLMAVGVVLIISDTVRMGILNRSAEIEIIDQVGGTHAFIRRPFLYAGALQGLLGALAAFAISSLALYLLTAPIKRLSVLYQSEFQIGWIALTMMLMVVMIASILGWLAARFTVDRHLRKLRPSARGM